eukprot:CAMPEP_0113959934 /NCGR_PEP_ID=MMETSP0011_2-20120614/4429_1 /TAXON_ID=101924 /ORGANISM="Rhodosorus marinus" /LENGTH=121 /DNA_ID=CAMNT_0000971319 /DNA_START=1246 /DNA_END=1611 /DNA_ORIENTATION=+ /assembly_acc=CAM_ASM_000156
MAFVGPLSAGRTSLSRAGKPAQCQRRRLEWRRVVRCQSSHLLLGAEQLTPAVEIYGKLFFFAIGLVVSTFVSIFFVGFLASRNIEEISKQLNDEDFDDEEMMEQFNAAVSGRRGKKIPEED